MAFWVQHKSNEFQTTQFKNQANDTAIERFENIFYELLSIQRENTNEVHIGEDTHGRRAFMCLFFEFRFCYFKVCEYLKMNNIWRNERADEVIDIAYHIFFMGLGDNSNKLVRSALNKTSYSKNIDGIINYLEVEVVKLYQLHKKLKLKTTFKALNPSTGERITFAPEYQPLGGHISRLGHYYRHLFQIAQFIYSNKRKIREFNDYEYAKTLRSQLSEYEQLLLYFNICSALGSKWLGDNSISNEQKINYIKEYRLLKNLPLPLVDFGILPKEKFKVEIQYWNEKRKSFFLWNEREQGS
jgi:hypothetical protein